MSARQGKEEERWDPVLSSQGVIGGMPSSKGEDVEVVNGTRMAFLKGNEGSSGISECVRYKSRSIASSTRVEGGSK